MLLRKLDSKILVLATYNPGKIAELTALLKPYHLSVLSAVDLELPSPEETGSTFVANAKLKALTAAKASGVPAIADDSGFSVAALEAAPGIYSARWAGPQKDFGLAMELVHYKMILSKSDDTQAWFTCALALAWPDGYCESAEGYVYGRVVWPPRGDNGFGYDSMFVPDGKNMETFGESSADKKHLMSHRTDAFAQLVDRRLDSRSFDER
ncbi:non-canonical purine NTP pyrophosphatase, rdgB/HAM1 family [Candidatus Endolissoclinum faulkneri L5]|uniref:dITP/XTP pyrophosphatase n=1 Tax=Candidatus Endolissoclinum faulkneri L5 TaxID=1401328 RepID=V9TUK5_9PROT|nr:RdgB/HAM1 family non-canonical purine NTP pyrophosphatase [Candidatus Endolissoclinum faulkneri]AHC73832.1 non-canonical purine NTP pyrophosphatase, rdgB/HAM1 family [Candidatus Endolissoclinum faulkneri L5]